MSRIIAVTGATGAQGGGLVRAILDDPERRFRVRAITRSPDGDKARALAEAGAEVVGADLDDAAALRRAFDGAWGAYCVTNFWEHFSPEKEIEQARNLAGAARDAGIGHAIWSTLEDVRGFVPLDDDRLPTLGNYKVPHFDGKGEADALFRDSGVPTTFLRTSFYWENLIFFGMGPQKSDDGHVLTLPMADRKLAGIAVADIGRCAFGIFVRGPETLGGAVVGIAGEHLDGSAMAAKLSRALGVAVRYAPLSFDAYRGLGFPGADDLGNMFQFYCDFEPQVTAARPIALARGLNPALQDFDTWLADNAARIPLG
jgi:uncharacterized protein YbjT (DUF2867 family)